MHVQELPTKIVSSAFELVRRPVSAVGDHLGPLAPRDIACWPPRMRIDALEGAVKETVGSLFHDEHMRASGRETREAVEKRRAALRAEATADAITRRADAELDETLDETEAVRSEAEQQAEARHRSSTQQGAARLRSVRNRTEQREHAVEQVAAETDEAIEREARARRLQALDAEAAALAAEQAASAAKRDADKSDTAIQRSRNARKRS